jgi:hypothetical protein
MGAHHNTLVNFLIMYQLMTTATLVQQVFGVFDSSVTYNSGESCFQPSVPVVKVPRHHNPGQNGKIHDQVGTAGNTQSDCEFGSYFRLKNGKGGCYPQETPKISAQPRGASPQTEPD